MTTPTISISPLAEGLLWLRTTAAAARVAEAAQNLGHHPDQFNLDSPLASAYYRELEAFDTLLRRRGLVEGDRVRVKVVLDRDTSKESDDEQEWTEVEGVIEMFERTSHRVGVSFTRPYPSPDPTKRHRDDPLRDSRSFESVNLLTFVASKESQS